MKKILFLLGLVAAFHAQAALISQYPNAMSFQSNDVTIIERPGDTNYNVKFSQMADAIGAQRTNANLTLWSAIAPSGKQDHSANLDLWSAVAPSSYQLSLGYIPQPASPNLTNWSGLATSAKQDHSVDLDLWSAIDPTTKLDTTGNGSGLTSLNASQLTSGTIASSRLGTGGTGGGTKFLADDQTFKNLPGSGDVIASANNHFTGTTNTFDGVVAGGTFSGNGAALTNLNANNITNLLPVDATTSTNNYAAFDSTGKLVGVRNGNNWTNLNTFDSIVPTFTGTAFWMGTNSAIITASNIYIISFVNLPPTGIERYGQLTIKATADITVTNLVAGPVTSSDMVSTRVCTNGNTIVLAFDVIPGVSTNLAVVQFH